MSKDISENHTDFDRELLSLYATPEIDFILFGILTTSETTFTAKNDQWKLGTPQGIL